MSQEKAQLIAPLGNVTFTGVTATGVITATSLSGNITGSASSIVQGTSITAGVVTASSFAGNLTGNIQRLADSAPNISVGVVTATSFSGNLTGSVTDLTSQPAITVGVVTATRFSGPVTGDIRGNVTGNVSGVATGNVTGNVDGDITGNVTGTIAGNVTGDVTGNASGHAGGLGVSYNGGWTGAGTSQISVGVITATVFHGDGQYLAGVSGGPVSAQDVTINGASTTIDLSNGNLIYATQSANTTVSFANSENGNVYFIRTKDDTPTTRTLTWPSRIAWEGGSPPTLIQDNPRAGDAQVFLLVTRDMGVTWYGKEVIKIDPQNMTLFAMGRSEVGGQLGLNSGVALSSPTQVGSSSLWHDIGNGRGGTNMEWQMATKSDGTLWAWGHNSIGVLGLNQAATTKISSPTQVPGTTWRNIAKGGRICSAVKTDGTFWTWGTASYGNLGQNQGYPDTTNSGLSSPTQISGSGWSTNPKHITVSGVCQFAIKQDGTLWAWGGNYGWGVLGLNNTGNRSSPVQLPGTDWSSITSGWAQGYAVKTDGSLWGWGENQYSSQLPEPMSGNTSSPRQVTAGAGTWSQVNQGVGARETGGGAAIGADGTLWCWGENDYGEIGNNTSTDVGATLTQVPGTTWRTVQGGANMTVATKTDNTFWAWGRNEYGKLGLNDVVDRSSPTQVPGTNYAALIGYCGNAAANGQSVFPLRIADP
jgi:hypothetical protein